jgi:sterol desaturase/sphingolipid hydroxylase (fatty acid hydroxylase superfamily)
MLNTIVLIIPLLLLIVFIEWYISYRHDRKTYTGGNFAMNVTIGAMDQVFSLFYFTALYFTLDFVYGHFRFWDLSEAWYVWLIAYIVVDFLSYWYHRFSHRINILWAGHVTHHSSEHFNFSNGFRTSFLQGINRILFWSVLPLFGFSPVMLVVILKVSGLYDFLLHTEYIPKLGVLEKFLITPSQHRVHHGRNEIYIDKNYGSTFNIWDKMFGTFQEETEKVEYGITGPYKDNNPFMAVGYYFNYLWRAMKTQDTLWKKIRLLFIPPDQTPTPDLSVKRIWPVTPDLVTRRMRNYAYTQILLMVPAMIVMLLYKDFIPLWEFILYAAIGISSVSVSAMILNNNVSSIFHKMEMCRLWISLFSVIILFAKHEQLYLLGVVFLLMVSLVLFTTIKLKKELVEETVDPHA